MLFLIHVVVSVCLSVCHSFEVLIVLFNPNLTCPSPITTNNQIIKLQLSLQFAGPGHRLSSGSSSSSSGGGGWLSGLTSQASPSSASVATATDREAIAARRLAAFGRGGSSGGGSHAEEHREQTERLLSGDGDGGKSDVQKLMDMGFQRHDAERALGLAGGSLNSALQLLTA